MKHERIIPDSNYKNLFFDTYIADEITGLSRDAVIVIPGGGYGEICSEREGEPIAMAFLPHGYNAFVLNYSVQKDGVTFPGQLIEVSVAIKYIKDHAAEFCINPERIFVCGFSAGGHLCASIGTMWHKDEIYEKIDMPFGYNKPTGVMLMYPVISTKHHEFSFKNMLNKETLTEDDCRMCSIDKNVDSNSSPAFILHTSNDQTVDVRNSLDIAKAYADNNLKFELHIYPDAPHGVALGNKITECCNPKYNNPSIAKWIENAVFWASEIKKEGN